MTNTLIYFFCYDNTVPSGGIKTLYRHVDHLNALGFRAFILHQKKDFRCTWFENQTPVRYVSEITFRRCDILVIPEDCFATVAALTQQANKIVFNQGCYQTFYDGYSFDLTNRSSAYLDKTTRAALVVSDDSKTYLEYAFPGLTVFRIHPAINADLFYFSDNKKPLISFMTRKNAQDALQVVNILKFRGALDGFEICIIDNEKEADVARIMRESLIFLSFSYAEGFSLPPAEAMACGAIVIGYHGMGGREFFDPDYSYPIPNADIIHFAKTVESVIGLYRADPAGLADKGRHASEHILKTYTYERERQDIFTFWDEMVNVKNDFPRQESIR
jgi:hypothetical protein